jgi:membrane-associated phospholipid phosphatase
VPARRALPEEPTSSAFPSVHAAAAAAFTTATTIQARPLAAVTAPAAALVGYSRVRTRVHWPSDVVAGALWGVVVGLLTSRIRFR